MTKIFTLAFAGAMLLTPPAFATAPTPEDVCRSVGELAEVIMSNRQAGIAMSVQRQHMLLGSTVDGFVAAMIQAAYDRPRYSTERNQRREIEDFRNETEATCYREVAR